MKHLYIEYEFTHFNNKRSLKAIKKKIDGNRQHGKHSKNRKKSHLYHQHRILIEAPENFSLIENFNDSMSFLKRLDDNIWQGHALMVDLSNVKHLTPDTILSIIACLDHCKNQKNHPDISGNAPDDPYCKQVFLDSGFYKYVTSSYRHNDTDRILSIRSDELVAPQEAGAVVQFVRDKLKIERNKMTKAAYTTIMEAMNNVREHAYTGRKNKRWWLMALPENNCDVIHFALLDNGKGIPTTIRKKIPEILFPNDSELIRSTVLEKNRSETRQIYRGLGLPNMKLLVDRKMIKNLYIISKKGKYYVDADLATDLKDDFIGTLICWDFVKEECNG